MPRPIDERIEKRVAALLDGLEEADEEDLRCTIGDLKELLRRIESGEAGPFPPSSRRSSPLFGRLQRVLAPEPEGAKDREEMLAVLRSAIGRISSRLAHIPAVGVPSEEGRTAEPARPAEDLHESGLAAAADLLRDLNRPPRGAAPPSPGPASSDGTARALPARLGDFQIIARIGRGGMGEVYRARQLSLDREVALKVLLPRTGRERTWVGRFLREARAAAGVNHPSIVQVFQAGIEDGLPYIAMQLVQGVSLDAVFQAGPPLQVRRALEIATDIARGLQAAHEAGVVHRDIKPGNVLIEGDARSARRTGRVYLADFGLASLEDRASLTRSGEILGTPAYMSPEQARGRPAERASDIYSLGATLYAMLAGTPPHEGSNYAAIVAQVAGKPPIPLRKRRPSVDRDTVTICEKAMRWEPRRRYGSAAEMADDIERRLARQPIKARAPTPIYPATLWIKRNPLPAAVAALAAILLLSSFAVDRALRRQTGLAEVEAHLRNREPDRAERRLQTVPRLPWPLPDSRRRMAAFRLHLAQGDLRRAAIDAGGLPPPRRDTAYADLIEVIDHQLETAHALLRDKTWWSALEFIWETTGGIEVLAVASPVRARWPDWPESASRRAALLTVSALLQAGEPRAALGMWEQKDLTNRIQEIRRTLVGLLRLTPSEEAGISDHGAFARRLTNHMLQGGFNRAGICFAMGGIRQGLKGEDLVRLRELALQKILHGALKREPEERILARGIFGVLMGYRHLLSGREAGRFSRWLELLESLEPLGGPVRLRKGGIQAAGDIDGDGVPDLVVTGENLVQVLACTESGLEARHALELEDGARAPSLALYDFDGDGADEIVLYHWIDARRREGGGSLRQYRAAGGRLQLAAATELPRIDASPETSPHTLTVADIDGDEDVELVVGMSSGGEFGRQVMVVDDPFTAHAQTIFLRSGKHPFLRGEEARSDVKSVFAADFDGDGRTEVGCVTGPWNGFDIRFWKYQDGRYVGPLRFGPLGTLGRVLPVERTGRRTADLFLTKISTLSYNTRSFPDPPHTGLKNGVYLFRFPANESVRAKTIALLPGDRGEIIPWSDPLPAEIVDPPDSLSVKSLSAGHGRRGETAVVVCWHLVKDGRHARFVDLYLENPEAQAEDAFSRFRVLWREDGRGQAALLLDLVAPERGSRRPGLVYAEERGTDGGWTAQLFAFSPPRDRDATSSLSLDVLEACRGLERYGEAASVARSAPWKSLDPREVLRLAAGWAMAAAADMDLESLREAITTWDRYADAVPERPIPAGLLRELESLRRIPGCQAALTTGEPRQRLLGREVDFPAVDLRDLDAPAKKEFLRRRFPEIGFAPRPLVTREPSNLRLTFDIEIEKLGWDCSAFIGLAPLDDNWRGKHGAYGVYVTHTGGAGQELRQAGICWDREIGRPPDRRKLLREGGRYRFALQRTDEGRVHLKVVDLASKEPVGYQTHPPSCSLETLEPETPGAQRGADAAPVPAKEFHFGVFGRPAPPSTPPPRLEGLRLKFENIELRLAPAAP